MPDQGTQLTVSKPDFSRHDASLVLLGVYLAAVAVRLVLNRQVQYPSILPDELWYWEYAQSMSLRHGVSWDLARVDFPSWLYPMTLAPFAKLMGLESGLRIARVMNVLLIHLALLPAYRFGRFFLDRRRAVAAAGLSALTATIGLCGTFMSENLYLPVFMLAAWFAVRALLSPSFRNRFIAGLALGLAFHVKPQGLSLPLIFGLAAAIFHGPALAEARWSRDAWRAFLVSLVAHWVTAAGWVVAMFPRAIEVLAYESHPHFFSLEALLGSYKYVATSPKPVGLGILTLLTFANFGVLLAATGFVPGYAFLRGCRRLLNTRTPKDFRAACAFTLATALLILPMMSRHSIAIDAEPQMHERYSMILYPMVFALWAAFGFRFRGAAYGWRGIAAYLVVAVAAFAAIIKIAIPARFTLSSGAPSLSGLFFLLDHPDSSRYFFAAILLVAAWTALQSVSRRWNLRPELAAAASVMLLANVGWYLNHALVLKPGLDSIDTVARNVARKIGDDGSSRLFIIDDGIEPKDAWIINFRNRAVEAYTDPAAAVWCQHSLLPSADGSLTLPPASSSAVATWILAAANHPLAEQPKEMVKGFALYKIDPAAPPRLVPAAERDAVTLAHRTADIFRGLKLIEGSAQIPKWTTGQTAKFAVQVKNEGDSKVSPKTGRIALAYHWSNFEATGSYNSVVWDDGRYGALPETLKPDKDAQVEWEIAAPPFADERWLLIIEPVYINGTERLFGGNDRQIRIKVPVAGDPKAPGIPPAKEPAPPASPGATAPAAVQSPGSVRTIKADPQMKVK